MNARDYYSILGVQPGASVNDINASFRRLVRNLHPDRQQWEGNVESPEFHALKRAHEVLSDDYKRSIYDKFGEEGLQFSEDVSHNPQLGALVQRRLSPQQLEHKIKKMHDLSKLDWYQKTVDYEGNTTLGMSLEAIKGVLKGERSIAESGVFGLGHRVKFAWSDDTAVHVRAGGQFVPHLRPHIEFSSELVHKPSVLTTVSAKSSFSTNGSEFTAGFTRRVDRNTTYFQKLKVAPRDEFQLIHSSAMTIGATRRLVLPADIQADGSMELAIGGISHIKSGGLKKDENFWSMGTRIGEDDAVVFAGLSRQLTKDTGVGLHVSAGLPSSWALNSQLNVWLSKITQLGVGLQLGTDGIRLTPSLTRLNHSFAFQITVAPTLSASLALSSVLASVVYSFLLRHLIVHPMRRIWKRQKLELKRTSLEDDRKSAQKFVEGMKMSIDAKRTEEEERGGLVILHASFGNLAKRPDWTGTTRPDMTLEDIPEDEEGDTDIILVADQLQYLVEDSELHITTQRKTHLPGFYDPCTGYENFLEVWYFFRGNLHHAIFNEDDEVHLPLRAHVTSS